VQAPAQCPGVADLSCRQLLGAYSDAVLHLATHSDTLQHCIQPCLLAHACVHTEQVCWQSSQLLCQLAPRTGHLQQALSAVVPF
jgi:hypothetical protein